ncbi:MAG: hypothetical protein ACLR0P_13665 [Oscillospiraceae bacterium]
MPGTLGLLLPRLAALGAVPAALLARYLDGVIQWLAGFPFSSVTMGPVYYRAWIVLVYLLALSAFLLPGRKRWTVVSVLRHIRPVSGYGAQQLEFLAWAGSGHRPGCGPGGEYFGAQRRLPHPGGLRRERL